MSHIDQFLLLPHKDRWPEQLREFLAPPLVPQTLGFSCSEPLIRLPSSSTILPPRRQRRCRAAAYIRLCVGSPLRSDPISDLRPQLRQCEIPIFKHAVVEIANREPRP